MEMENLVRIIAFDLETTGIDHNKHEIIEIGALKFSVKENKGRIVPEILDKFESFVKASKPIPAEATRVNNITNEMLSTAPSCAVVLRKFKLFCDDANYLVAHNAPFDTAFLNIAYGKHSVAAPRHSILDSLKISRNLIQLPSYKLGAISKVMENRNEISFKTEEGAMHRALYDCEMLMHVLVALLKNRLSIQEWTMQDFLKALKNKDILQDFPYIKPIKPKVVGLF